MPFRTILFFITATFAWAGPVGAANHPSPTEKLDAVSMEPNLIIGAEDDEDLMLGAATDVVITKNGDIFILDIESHRILKYNAEGQFLAELGGEGQGPGEITKASGLGLTIDENLIVADMGRKAFSILERDGTFIKQIPFPSSVAAVYMPAGGTDEVIGYSAAKLSPNAQPIVLWMLSDKNGKVLTEIYPNQYENINWKGRSEPGWYADFLRIQFEAEAGGSPRGDWMGDRFVVCRESQYAGRFIDAKGKEIGAFSRKHKPKIFSEEARYAYYEEVWEAVRAVVPFSGDLTTGVFRKALTLSDLPITLHPISRVFTTEQGFGILSNYDAFNKKGDLHFFNSQGNLLKETSYQGTAKVFKYDRGQIYAMGYDEDGNNCLNRIKVDHDQDANNSLNRQKVNAAGKSAVEAGK